MMLAVAGDTIGAVELAGGAAVQHPALVHVVTAVGKPVEYRAAGVVVDVVDDLVWRVGRRMTGGAIGSRAGELVVVLDPVRPEIAGAVAIVTAPCSSHSASRGASDKITKGVVAKGALALMHIGDDISRSSWIMACRACRWLGGRYGAVSRGDEQRMIYRGVRVKVRPTVTSIAVAWSRNGAADQHPLIVMAQGAVAFMGHGKVVGRARGIMAASAGRTVRRDIGCVIRWGMKGGKAGAMTVCASVRGHSFAALSATDQHPVLIVARGAGLMVTGIDIHHEHIAPVAIAGGAGGSTGGNEVWNVRRVLVGIEILPVTCLAISSATVDHALHCLLGALMTSCTVVVVHGGNDICANAMTGSAGGRLGKTGVNVNVGLEPPGRLMTAGTIHARVVRGVESVFGPIVGQGMANLANSCRRRRASQIDKVVFRRKKTHLALAATGHPHLGTHELAIEQAKTAPVRLGHHVAGHGNGRGVGGQDFIGGLRLIAVSDKDQPPSPPCLGAPGGWIAPCCLRHYVGVRDDGARLLRRRVIYCDIDQITAHQIEVLACGCRILELRLKVRIVAIGAFGGPASQPAANDVAGMQRHFGRCGCAIMAAKADEIDKRVVDVRRVRHISRPGIKRVLMAGRAIDSMR